MARTIIFMKRPNDDAVDMVCEHITKWARGKGFKIDYPINAPTTRSPTIVALGGDGTMLGAARLALQTKDAHLTTIVGFNMGHLGFLTEEIGGLRMQDHQLMFTFLEHVIEGHTNHYVYDERMTLSLTSISPTEKHSKQTSALNEGVLTAGDGMLEVTIKVNGQHVAKYNGSGAIVSTSTGSTALALSAGGAIISPNTNVMQIVPMLPHSMTIRPIITTGRDEVTIEGRAKEGVKIRTLHDGLELQDTDKGELNLHVQQNGRVHLCHPLDWDHYKVLSTKMGWNHNGCC